MFNIVVSTIPDISSNITDAALANFGSLIYSQTQLGALSRWHYMIGMVVSHGAHIDAYMYVLTRSAMTL